MTGLSTRSLFGIALVALVSTGASAQPNGPPDPCQKDAAKLCKDAVPDQAKIAACLKANQSKLSSTCRKSFDTRSKAKGA